MSYDRATDTEHIGTNRALPSNEKTRLLPPDETDSRDKDFRQIVLVVFCASFLLLAGTTFSLLLTENPVPRLFFAWFLVMVSSQTWLLYQYLRKIETVSNTSREMWYELIVASLYILGYSSNAVTVYLFGPPINTQNMMAELMALDFGCVLSTVFLWAGSVKIYRDRSPDREDCCRWVPECGCLLDGCVLFF